MAQRWKVVCEYDGTEFSGWQVQRNGTSVQQIIEARLASIFGSPVRIHGSGRTDAGVHARGQVFHFDADWSDEPHRLQRALSGTLPPSIILRRLSRVSPGFHARFSATSKLYAYRFYLGEAPPHLTRFHASLHPGITRRLHPDRMREALQLLEGWHDFAAFAVNRGSDYAHTWRSLRSATLKCSAGGRIWTLRFEGNGFLYKMARSLAGASLAVATGQLSTDQLNALLEGKLARKAHVTTAPAKGLSLEQVFYTKRSYPSPPPHAPANLQQIELDPTS